MRRLVHIAILMALGTIPIQAQQRSFQNGIVRDSDKLPQIDLLTKRFPQHPYIVLNTAGVRFANTSLVRNNATAREDLKFRQIAPDFYYQNCYGFFCKMEWRTQNQWHLPISFRLGSYHYERRLEGEE